MSPFHSSVLLTRRILPAACRRLSRSRTYCLVIALAAFVPASLAPRQAAAQRQLDFNSDIEPILANYCSGCHYDGANEGGFSFNDLFIEADREKSNAIWYRVLRKLQSRSMPPSAELAPSDEERVALVSWIKYSAFGIDPSNPDPGRVTLRRLNQVEYRNTVRDLIGVDYDTSANFPADDTGHGFDNIGDVLSMSPLLLEKYVNAAKEIVSQVVPTVSGIPQKNSVPGAQFKLDELTDNSAAGQDQGNGVLVLSYYMPASARATFKVDHTGLYTVRLRIIARETYVDGQFDENKCEFRFTLDDEILLKREFVRQGRREYTFDFALTLEAGQHELVTSIRPLSNAPQIRRLRLHLEAVDMIGPMSDEHFIKPEGYKQFFPRDVPASAGGRRGYARELLRKFAFRAYRRPVEDSTVDRLVTLAESVYTNGQSFESGVAKSMTAILASPSFLFREEAWSPENVEEYPLIDEFSLASRLSYFLWSTLPDQELIELAQRGALRDNLDVQVTRMLNHVKAQEFFKNFTGQWLRARAVGTIQVNGPAVLSREPTLVDPEADLRRRRFFALFRKGEGRTKREEAEFEQERANYLQSFRRGSRSELTSEVRLAMRRETEMLFERIVSENRSLLEIVDSDYTFLNEPLWAHYQIAGIEPIVGDEMRLVDLPANSLRGGVLTQGTMLVVTSNPDRTSPVKRGLFILENLLGTPPAAPPPNIPALEDVESPPGEQLSLRETLARHRASPVCSSCHDRMDPLGLALEKFNALGRYRTEELGRRIETAGVLESGESFSSIRELKKILASRHATDLYRCVTEKMMTYALGRSVEYTDAHTVDRLVDELKATEGRAQSLIRGIIRSPAFQRTRKLSGTVASN